jgi:hypothetical protein
VQDLTVVNTKYRLKAILSDIRFWIILFFLIRLIGITNPPLESGHNWRQSLTNMIARNFYEVDSNILYPRIDMAGDKSGIIGSEFPFFNYLIYIVSSVFGYTHWYGRIINLIVSGFGAYYFYLLVKNLLNKKVAFNATIILTLSIWFTFSRKIMPDTFSVSLVIIGLFMAYKYLFTGNLFSLILYFIFCSLGVLCKIPALSLLGIAVIPLFDKKIPRQRKFIFYSISIGGLVLIYLWYFQWVPHLLEKYQYQLYFPKGIVEGFSEIKKLFPETLEKFYFSSLQSYLAFCCFIGGLVILLHHNNRYIYYTLGVVTLVFLVFILKTGSVFPLHNYYVIPYTPIMALVAGLFINKIPQKYATLLLVIIGIEAVANQQHDFFLKKNDTKVLRLEYISGEYIEKDKLVVINAGPSPQQLYFLNRKGWTIDDNKLNQHKLNELISRGAAYLVIHKPSHLDTNRFSLIYTDSDFDLYRLINIE